MKATDVWHYTHSERALLADQLASLSSDQWSTPSLCEGWNVKQLSAHVLAAAEQTIPGFYKDLATSGFSFNKLQDKGIDRLGGMSNDDLVARLRKRTTTTNHPPAPVVAMLGEIVVHGQDIRRPLGVSYTPPEAALIAVADNYKKSNFLIGSKARIAGLSLRATDADWSNGTGPEVTGPLTSLVMAMTGRKSAIADLSGEGVSILAGR